MGPTHCLVKISDLNMQDTSFFDSVPSGQQQELIHLTKRELRFLRKFGF